MSENDTGPSSSEELINRPPPTLQVLRARTALYKPGESHQAITPQFMLNAVRQWWKAAIPIGLILAGVGGWYVHWSFVPVYRATTLLEIGPQKSILYPSRDSRSTQRFADTQMEQMRHPLVLDQVASEIGTLSGAEDMEEARFVEWLSKRLQFERLGQSELFELSFQHPDPDTAALIVNTVVNKYFELRASALENQRGKIRTLLQDERTRWEDQLVALREEVSMLTAQANEAETALASLRQERAGDTTLLANLRARLIAAETEQTVLKAQIQAAEQLRGSDLIEVPDWRVERAVEANQEVLAREAELSSKRFALRELESRLVAPEQDADCRARRKEIERLEEMLGQVREELAEQVEADLQESLGATFTSDLNQMKAELARQEQLTQVLQLRYDDELRRYNEEREKSQQPVENAQELESLASLRGLLARRESELSHAEGVYDQITERLRQLDIESKADDRVTCLRPAGLPTTPVESVPLKMMALTSLIGLCLPFGVAIIWEYMVKRVSNPQDLEQDPNLSVLAEITRLPSRVRRSGTFSSNGNGQPVKVFEESVNNLAASLTLSDDLGDARTLAVTSAAQHEGKTSLAVALPASIARACGKPVLLIDGDMRSPDIHNVFGIPLQPGLADVLRGECSLEEAIATKGTNSVHVLPAGKLRANPLSLVTSGAMKSLLDRALDSYHCIIIDTPPILAASEALVLAKVVDACLMCAMRDVSRIDQVRRACQRLATVGVQPIGTVFNGVPARRYAYRYGTYDYAKD